MSTKNKLGKLAPKAHPKTLDLAKYVLASEVPGKVYWEYKLPPASIGMFKNDEIGDCTCAMVAHYIMLATAHTGKLVVPEESDVVGMYSALSGYDPSTGANDNGVAMTDVFEYWQTTGLAGHKILGWASIDYKNLDVRHLGIWAFGACHVGVQLPANAQTQFDEGKTWDVSWWNNSIEGGHAILETGFGKTGSNFQSWGKGDQKATNAWTAKYIDEAYVVITQDWLDQASGLTPSHFNLDALQADLAKVRT